MFRRFVEVISTKDHPIALFIDDLQWADSASLSLLKVLMTDPGNKYLLCICAYRDNEVNASHPFMITVNEMKELHAKMETIQLGNLSKKDVNSLVSEALGTQEEKTFELTDLVYSKTQGNAFFVNQIMNSLYDNQLIKFNYDSNSWKWDMQDLLSLNLTDNVADLMVQKAQTLSDNTQESLKLAACIGAQFDLATLSIILEKSEEETYIGVEEALATGMIIPFDDEYKFAQDRIQQALNSMIPSNEKSQTHLKIGKLLLEKIPEDQMEDRLFDIVDQWNRGIDMISSQKEKDRLAYLNLRAGKKAKLS